MLADYPRTSPLTIELRPLLHPLFRQLREGISEFTFANLYLFRVTHQYSAAALADGTIAFLGRDGARAFFILPFALPEATLLDTLFHDHGMLKCASTAQARLLAQQGYRVEEDRNNFDYLYRRADLALLGGRNYHKKRSLIKAFTRSHSFAAKPLRSELREDALRVLEDWRLGADELGDYEATREAVHLMDPLQLCGGIYYVESQPVAFVLGEELTGSASYAIHFEKAVPGYKGLYQFINQSFAAVLPEEYATINREQDLGDPGLRQAKMSYFPAGFVEKFKVYPKDSPSL
ncbi:MAG: DUF2156 domain-containing protein [Desulfobulbus sp.]|nr:DUF2156 domain-containing protein [Desulfobulbus sp.]